MTSCCYQFPPAMWISVVDWQRKLTRFRYFTYHITRPEVSSILTAQRITAQQCYEFKGNVILTQIDNKNSDSLVRYLLREERVQQKHCKRNWTVLWNRFFPNHYHSVIPEDSRYSDIFCSSIWSHLINVNLFPWTFNLKQLLFTHDSPFLCMATRWAPRRNARKHYNSEYQLLSYSAEREHMPRQVGEEREHMAKGKSMSCL